MINNPINTTKGKHTLHLPLGGPPKGVSLGIWMDKCAHFKVYVNMHGFVCKSVIREMKQFKFMLYIL